MVDNNKSLCYYLFQFLVGYFFISMAHAVKRLFFS